MAYAPSWPLSTSTPCSPVPLGIGVAPLTLDLPAPLCPFNAAGRSKRPPGAALCGAISTATLTALFPGLVRCSRHYTDTCETSL
jgi:hypothetical protein